MIRGREHGIDLGRDTGRRNLRAEKSGHQLMADARLVMTQAIEGGATLDG